MDLKIFFMLTWENETPLGGERVTSQNLFNLFDVALQNDRLGNG